MNDPIVMRDSEGIREVYQRPVGSDFDALIAREMLALAQDEEAVKALDLHLAESALRKLSGEQGNSVPATIEILVRSPPPADNTDVSIRKILATTLRPKLGSIEHPERYLPNARDDFKENRELTPDLWASNGTSEPKDAAPYWLHLFILTENASPNAVSQFDADLHIDLPAGPLKLTCKEPRFSLTPLPPGAATLHDCGTEGHRADLRQLTAAVDTIRKGGSGWTLVPSRINFVDPPVGLTRRGVYWLSSGAAAIKAREAIAAMSCQQRGSCSGDFGRELNANPQYVIGAMAVVAGVIAGWLIGLFARRPAKTTLLGLGAIIAIGIGILVALGMTLTGMDALIVLVLAIFGAFGVAGLVIGLLVGLVLGQRRQRA